MDRFEMMRVFACVVEAGGFTRAAERLALSRAVVSKHVIQLEERLGVRLLNRTTRRVSLTETGRAFHQHCTRILADVEEAERAVSELHSEPRGELRVVAPTNFGLPDLGTAITEFMTTYPRVRIDLSLNDRYVDPIEAGYDIAVRIGEPRDTAWSSLMARKINTSRRILCASPEYLARCGVPQRPEDLSDHDCLCYSYLDTPAEWRLIGPKGECTVKVWGPLVTSHGQVLKMAVLRGLGIAYGPTYFFHDDILAGRVQMVLPQFRAPEVSIFSVYPASRHLSAKVRAFNDFMVRYFAARPAVV
jgi:DNA-binding transcriptional LysR family regulator